MALQAPPDADIPRSVAQLRIDDDDARQPETAQATAEDEGDEAGPSSPLLIPQVASELLPRLFSILFSARQDLPVLPSAPFRTVPIPSKGLGSIATRPIARGELLISEPPLVVWPQGITAETARAHIDALSPEGRELFWGLGNGGPEGSKLDEVLAIRATNGFAVELPPVEAHIPLVNATGEPEARLDADENLPKVASMIFPRIARLNHSCLPNADQAMNWETLRMEVWATTDIKEGEEVNIEYTPLLQRGRSSRSAHLQATFAFTCSCALCSSPETVISASDDRRDEVDKIVKTLAEGGKGQRGEKMQLLERLDELVKEEDYVGVPEFDEPAISQAFSMFRTLKGRLARQDADA